MSDRGLIRSARLIAGFAVVVGLAGGGIVILGGWDFLVDGFAIHAVVGAVGFGVLAWVTVAGQPRNRDVWALAFASFFASLAVAGAAVVVQWGRVSVPGFTYDLAVETLLSHVDLPAGIALVSGASSWGFGLALFTVLTFGLLRFPDGKLPSPRWTWVAWFSAAAIAIETIASFLWIGLPSSTTPLFAFEFTLTPMAVIALGTLIVPAVAAVLCVASLVVRYRSSQPVIRRQILWIGWGGAILASVAFGSVTAVVFGALVTDEPAIPTAAIAFAVSAAEAVLIACFFVAITRHRLYDIDLVISRTITYGGLALFITVAYVGVVVGIGSLFGQGDEPNLALAVGATAFVALLFEPIREGLQRWANRLAYGQRATPYSVLSGLSARFSDAGSNEDVLHRLAELLASGTGADAAVVWLRVGDRLRPEVVSGERHPTALDLRSGSLPTLPGDASQPVTQGEDLLGALSIDKQRGQPVTPADRQLLEDVAAAAGLLLRNIRLNAELADRASEIRVSRRRLVAAQDAERRRLERNLHDGAQQQVVALKVKLGLAKTMAEREEVGEIAAAVGGLADDAQRAVDGMRAAARGIYPPLLEAEGIRAALVAAARDLETSVAIDADLERRFPAEVEATVYFTVVEALNPGARVSITEDDGDLRFEVENTGAGTGIASVADRIDALGGSLDVQASPNGEQMVVGRIPVAALEPV